MTSRPRSMPRAERSRGRLIAYGFLAGVAALLAIPAYLTVPADWRPLVARLVCGLIVFAGGLRIVGRARRAIEGAPPSPLDAAPPPRPRPELDERFLRLRDDVRFGIGSRRYFETIVWPRLCALGAAGPPPVTERRVWRRRGPSSRELERIIAE